MLDLDKAAKFLGKLHIRDRDSGRRVPFIFNANQQKIHEKVKSQADRKQPIRILSVKSRRVGFSSYVEGINTTYSLANPGLDSRIVAHLDDTVDLLFSIPTDLINDLRRQFPSLGIPKPTADRIVIPHDGGNATLSIATARTTAGGRGGGFYFLHLCLAGDSLINVGNGDLVKISDLKVGDVVRTHTGALGQISTISSRSTTIDEAVVTVKTWLNCETLTLTADHKVWTQRGWVKAGELTPQDYIGTAVRRILGTKTTLALPHWENPKGKKVIGGDVPLDKEFGFFVGYYLAEGSTKNNTWKGGKRAAASISFAHHHKEIAFAERACAAVKPWITSHRTVFHEGGFRATTSVYGSTLATLIYDQFGNKDNKRIPEWVFDAPREFIEGIVIGYLAGDGSKGLATHGNYSCPTIYATSIRPRLLYQLRHLLAALGWGWGGIGFEPGFVDNRGCNNRDSWTASLNGTTALQLRKELGLEIPVDSDITSARRVWTQKYKLSDEYVWTKVKTVSPANATHVWDIEVAHEDHSFETVVGAVANSEAAFYTSSDSLTSLLNAVPDHASTAVFIESTAFGKTGIGEPFYKRWMAAIRGDSEYIPVFLSWTDDPACVADPEYLKRKPLDDEEKVLAKILSPEQLAWRRRTLIDKCEGSIDRLNQEYPLDWEMAFVSSGNPAFNREEMALARTSIQPPIFRGQMNHDGSYVPNDRGPLVIWQKPEKNSYYYIGVDGARGEEAGGKDFSTAVILNGTTNEIVGRYMAKIGPTAMAHIVNKLGREYNNAKVIVELTGNLGLLMVQDLRDKYHYPNLYKDKKRDDRAVQTKTNLLGLETNYRTRPIYLSNFREALKHGDLQVRDEELVAQMDLAQWDQAAGQSFVVRQGHDDLLMGALFAVTGCRHYPPPVARGSKRLLDDPDQAQPSTIIIKDDHQLALVKHVRMLQRYDAAKKRGNPLAGI